MLKTVACIIARTNSTRLPKKVLKNVNSKFTLIEYLIEKTKKSRLVDEIYICTSKHIDDQVLKKVAEKKGVKFYAGSLDSVIDRMLDVAKLEKATDVIRITGDNIFTDEVYLDIMIDQHFKKKVEYTRTENLPIGVTAEVIKVEALKRCYNLMNPEESQYLMLYMFQPSIFKCLVLLPEIRHSQPNYSLTVDTPLDFERTLRIISSNDLLSLDQILETCNKKEIKNLIYKKNGMVKFPANLKIYFETYRIEMDMRIKMSSIYNVKPGEYLNYKKKLNV